MTEPQVSQQFLTSQSLDLTDEWKFWYWVNPPSPIAWLTGIIFESRPGSGGKVYLEASASRFGTEPSPSYGVILEDSENGKFIRKVVTVPFRHIRAKYEGVPGSLITLAPGHLEEIQ